MASEIVCAQPPTCWATRWGLASWSTCLVKSCKIKMLKCTTQYLRRARSPTSWYARKTTRSTTSTVKPLCKPKDHVLENPRKNIRVLEENSWASYFMLSFFILFKDIPDTDVMESVAQISVNRALAQQNHVYKYEQTEGKSLSWGQRSQ